MIYAVFWISLLILYFLFFFYWVFTLTRAAPYYPSNSEIVGEIVKYVKKHPQAHVAELGAGDGRIVFALAKAGIKVTGIEVNPFFSLFMRARFAISRFKNVEILNRDFFKINLKKYNIVVAYLLPDVMGKLEVKIYQEMRKGSILLTNTFTLKKHMPSQVIKKKLYVYKIF